MIEENFSLVSEAINFLYCEKWGNTLKSPDFSMYRMMARIWRKFVLDPITSEIHDIILNLIQLYRKRIAKAILFPSDVFLQEEFDIELVLKR